MKRSQEETEMMKLVFDDIIYGKKNYWLRLKIWWRKWIKKVL